MELKEIEKSIIERTITKITSLATKIRVYCFYGCHELTDISFPKATSIGSYAFSGCTALTSVDIPKATSIGSYAFSGCTALTSVDIPKATSIGIYAFSNCGDLNVHLYPGVLSIANQGFLTTGMTNRPPKAIYLHYTDADEVLFTPSNMIGAGSSKGTLTYNIYTDNTIIKDGVLSKADQYTIVNVYHLDGSDWV